MLPRPRLAALVAACLAAACGAPPVAVDQQARAGTDEGPPPESAGPAEPAVEPRVLVDGPAFEGERLERLLALSPLPPPPDDPTNAFDDDPRAARLGHWLFYDARLSGSGEVSCATCHDPALGWADGKRLASATGTLSRHAMTLWNVAHNRWYFWDGRADSLWMQALQPLEDPREHATTRLAVCHLVDEDPELRAAYEETFGPLPSFADRARFPADARPVPDDPSHPHAVAWAAMDPADRASVERVFTNLGKAIAAFERRIVSDDAPFDRFVAGVRAADARAQAALGEDALRGAALFLGKARCHLCHTGPEFTDREFHDDRVPQLEGGMDKGRFGGIELVEAHPFNGAGAFSDDPEAGREKVGYLRRTHHNYGEFKTPSLRNVARTAPYMHQGQLATLEDVVRYYSTLEDALPLHHTRGELLLEPVNLDDGEVADLVAFLESLTDTELPAELRAPPPSPRLDAP